MKKNKQIVLIMVILAAFSAVLRCFADELISTSTAEETEGILSAAENFAIAHQYGRQPTAEKNEFPWGNKFKEGMIHSFFISDPQTARILEFEAQVIYVGDHIIFWADDTAVNAMPQDIRHELQRFDQETLPKLESLFSPVLTDKEQREPVHGVFSGYLDPGAMGYFSPEDLADPAVRPFSNGMEMFFLNPLYMFRDHGAFLSETLSHEFQHMLHYRFDPNEDDFIHEGLSGLFEWLGNGTFPQSRLLSWYRQTGNSLTQWSLNPDNEAYYGSAFLFAEYLYERLGEEGIRQIIAAPENGMNGIDRAVKAYDTSADELFTEWNAVLLTAFANLNESSPHDRAFTLPPHDEDFSFIPLSKEEPTAHQETHQYGSDFFKIECPSAHCKVTLSFEPTLPVLQSVPEGSFGFWSNAFQGNSTILFASADLTKNIEDPVLSFSVAYQIEKDFDFLTLRVSEDKGENWDILKTESSDCKTRPEARFLCAYTGNSDGMVRQHADLSPYIGKEILIAFHYRTDPSGIADGAWLTDFSLEGVPLIWQTKGFSAISNTLPQRFSAVFSETNEAAAQLFPKITESREFLCESEVCYLAVSPISRFSRCKSPYTLTFSDPTAP